MDSGERNITADTARRLGIVLGTAPQFWIRLQANYDLQLAKIGFDSARIVPVKCNERARDSLADEMMCSAAPHLYSAFNPMQLQFAMHCVLQYCRRMHVISRAIILDATRRHPQHQDALNAWYRIMKSSEFGSFADLKRTFNSVDKVGNYCVFNVAGNHMRVVTAIHFNRGKCFIRHVVSHSEYDRLRLK